MRKKNFKIASLRDGGDSAYWKRKSYSERLSALEQVRRVVFGYDPSTIRFQRIIKITQLKKN